MIKPEYYKHKKHINHLIENQHLGANTKSYMNQSFYSSNQQGFHALSINEYKRIMPCKRVDQKMI